jgi:hypothetical protein
MAIQTRVSPRLLTITAIAGLVLIGCAPNRAEWMAREEKHQAAQLTQQIGSPEEVKSEARVASNVLSNLSAAISAAPGSNPQIAMAFARDASMVASGLDTIASSQTDEEFTNAVLGMCAPERRDAEPRVGQVMLGAAGVAATNPHFTPEQRQQVVSYFQTFGRRLIGIPVQCEQATSAMQTAEQNAELRHQSNVSTALTMATVLFVGTAMVAGEVGAAAATRPPVQNNYMYVNQYNRY